MQLLLRRGRRYRFFVAFPVVIATKHHGLFSIAGRRHVGVLAHAFFHLFARFERNHFLGFDIHPFSGARISGLARLAHLHFEDAEIPEFGSPNLE
jgi:hypothetical protein